MARIRMAVIKCVPPVPGLSTRAIGFTYESHTPTSFHRSHPPIYSNLSNDSKFATNFPFALSLALQKIVKTMKWGKKYPISIRTVQISIAKGSDRIRPSFLHLPRNSFVSRPPPRTRCISNAAMSRPLSRVANSRGGTRVWNDRPARQDRETTLSRNPRRLHKTWRGYREKGRGGTRGVKYERLGGPRRDGTTGGGGKEGEAANG